MVDRSRPGRAVDARRRWTRCRLRSDDRPAAPAIRAAAARSGRHPGARPSATARGHRAIGRRDPSCTAWSAPVAEAIVSALDGGGCSAPSRAPVPAFAGDRWPGACAGAFGRRRARAGSARRDGAVAAAWRRRRAGARSAGLAPHLDEPLHRGDRGEHEHHPRARARAATSNSRPKPSSDDALGPLHEAALGVEAERLGLGPLVGDRASTRPSTANGSTAMCRGAVSARYQATPPSSRASVTRSATESKKAPRARRGAGGLGHRAVEQVGRGRSGRRSSKPMRRCAGCRWPRRRSGQSQPEGGEVVGVDAGAAAGLRRWA